MAGHYQGGQPPGNGYWGNQNPPNPYNTPSQHSPQNHNTQQQYRTPNNGQYWSQNAPSPYGSSSQAYSSNGYHAPAVPQQNYEQPQFISPAQIFQQSLVMPQAPQSYQHTPQSMNGGAIPNSLYINSSRMSPASAINSQPDTALLLVSLAEEYFAAAHELAPKIVLSMTDTDIEAYERLIATGLGCLDTALKRVKLAPRQEANIRLRYAGVLFEETENYMEAEVALSKGISLCERHHYHDIKYAMQFLLAQFMAKKSPKASIKMLDTHIADAQAYQHFPWVYAFRFLRASQAMESGSLSDNSSTIQNLRAIADLATQQQDHAIHLTASLMEALAYLKMPGPEALEHVQRALAAAWGNQMNDSCKIPQLVGLTHILDVASSIKQAVPAVMFTKLRGMQDMMDESLKDPIWGTSNEIIAIPIKRTNKSSSVVSSDTRRIIGIGANGDDNLMMSFLSKKDAYSVTYLLCGMVFFFRNSSELKSMRYLQAGLESLEADMTTTRISSGLLPELIAKRHWRGQIICHFHIYMAFCFAGTADWPKVKKHINDLEVATKTFEIPLAGVLGVLATYLTGMYHQGTGNLDTALQILQDPKFDLSRFHNQTPSAAAQVEKDISLLAALNRIWILQERPRQNFAINAELLATLEPLCAHNPNKDIQTAFNLINSTVGMNPPTPLIKIKSFLRAALSGATATGNTQFLCITLNIMCSKFFNNILGDQAEKSAKAAVVQADKSGNILWKSVADGMLAHCFDVQGKTEEGRVTRGLAESLALQAFPGS